MPHVGSAQTNDKQRIPCSYVLGVETAARHTFIANNVKYRVAFFATVVASDLDFGVSIFFWHLHNGLFCFHCGPCGRHIKDTFLANWAFVVSMLIEAFRKTRVVDLMAAIHEKKPFTRIEHKFKAYRTLLIADSSSPYGYKAFMRFFKTRITLFAMGVVFTLLPNTTKTALITVINEVFRPDMANVAE